MKIFVKLLMVATFGLVAFLALTGRVGAQEACGATGIRIVDVTLRTADRTVQIEGCVGSEIIARGVAFARVKPWANEVITWERQVFSAGRFSVRSAPITPGIHLG